MKMIVIADENWNIGLNGGLLAHLPNDLKYFKEKTEGQIVVMGRKTLESLPNGRPLPNRINVVLTRNEGYTSLGAISMKSIKLLKTHCSVLKHANGLDTYVVGGGEVYKKLLPIVNTVYVTKIRHKFKADTSFPNLDKLKNEWKLVDVSPVQHENGLDYTFDTYERID